MKPVDVMIQIELRLYRLISQIFEFVSKVCLNTLADAAVVQCVRVSSCNASAGAGSLISDHIGQDTRRIRPVSTRVGADYTSVLSIFFQLF